VHLLAHDREDCRAVEYDKGELLQVDLMNPIEDLLPHAWIKCRQLLLVKGIQSRIAIEVKVLSSGRELVARPQPGIVGVIAKVLLKLGCNIDPSKSLPQGQKRAPTLVRVSDLRTTESFQNKCLAEN
jgi:hypothetical protein